MLTIEQYKRAYPSVKYIPKFKIRTKVTTTPIVISVIIIIVPWPLGVVNSKFSFLRGSSSEADVFTPPIVRYYYCAYSKKLLTSFFLLLLSFRPALHSARVRSKCNTCKPLRRISKRNTVLMRIIPRCGCSWKKEARGATDGSGRKHSKERERGKECCSNIRVFITSSEWLQRWVSIICIYYARTDAHIHVKRTSWARYAIRKDRHKLSA